MSFSSSFNTFTMSTSPTRTIIHVNNLHCQSCVASVRDIVNGLDTKATLSSVEVSLAERTLSFTHPLDFDLRALLKQIYAAGFDVELQSSATASSKPGPSKWTTYFKKKFRRNNAEHEAKHKQVCLSCRIEKGEALVGSPVKKGGLRESIFALDGVTSSSCTSTISNILSPNKEPCIHSSQVTGNPPSAVVVHDDILLAVDVIKELIENAGYGAELVSSETVLVPASTQTYKVILSIEGMTCSSCTSSVSSALERVPGVSSIMIDLIGNSGSVVVQRKEDAEAVKNEVEDAGFDCAIVDILKQNPLQINEVSKSNFRTVTIRVDGMFCNECVKKVESTLRAFSSLTFSPFSLSNPHITLTYAPSPPDFTIRTIIAHISSLSFSATALSPISLEDRAAAARLREERRLRLLIIAAFIFAIPTFTVAVIGMSLLKKSNAFRMHLESPVWGNATLGTILLFALATPVQFGIGTFFYTRSWKSVRTVWRKRTGNVKAWEVWRERLVKWGSMDSLVVLGTTVGYVASLALMVLDVRTKPMEGMMGGDMAWFDSSVFLMFFIICGRYLESLTKHRTSSAITALSATLPSGGLLLSPSSPSAPPIDTPTPLLEIGDTLLIPVGASPPLDGTLSPSSPPTSFTESSLTGESTPVAKRPSAEDPLYAGTINAGPNAAVMVVSSQPGQTMLDGIVGVVREAMGRKAGIEKLADLVTAWFVPAVVGVAAFTFAVWCLRGYVGDLPAEWLDSGRGGGWVVFAVQFGVAVLVVACPCGIGLAGPTAQMVGIGLAAQHGVLSNGGGEAFQALSNGVDVVVMDKTGTITQGNVCVGKNDVRLFSSNSEDDTAAIVAMIRTAENASTHPIAVGIREWCDAKIAGFGTGTKTPALELVSSKEIPGRGILATLMYKCPPKDMHDRASEETLVPLARGKTIELAVGNDKLLRDVGAVYPRGEPVEEAEQELRGWRMAGKSVVLVSARFLEACQEADFDFFPRLSSTQHAIIGQLGIHDPPRPEAALLVSELAKLGIEAWMLTGDNEVTAQSVAQSVGIESQYVIAGALPTDKQEWVKRLQKGQLKKPSAGDESTKSKIVAFIGDGINDAPALAQADVSLAMGSGSRIALSTASFTLLSSRAPLLSFLTIHHIARITRRKIMTNFVWACIYNVGLIPFAAGAFYEIAGKRTTLPPVWASAAMAASSVSVVVNSLALRWRFREPEVVRRWREQVV